MYLHSVTMTENQTVFGMNTKQFSSTMEGLHLSWNGKAVIVTHDLVPGQEEWLLPAGIAKLTFKKEAE